MKDYLNIIEDLKLEASKELIEHISANGEYFPREEYSLSLMVGNNWREVKRIYVSDSEEDSDIKICRAELYPKNTLKLKGELMDIELTGSNCFDVINHLQY